jgi:anthranilate phosphoribosyltransferase
VTDSEDLNLAEPEHVFAPYVRTLGRGPGRSRALTRDEARVALQFVLDGVAEPVQIGAFLMLLRYRGEDPAELAGLTDAARAACAGPKSAIDLDWPSYGAGRTRKAPWFLLAALALAQTGRRILMHGTNAFSTSQTIAMALQELGLAPAESRSDALRQLDRRGFAYLPLKSLAPALDRLLGLRRLFGLRSPINTVVRLLNPFDAPCGLDGVFHPAYIEAHLAAAALLQQPHLVLVKGAGGEAERNPAKPVTAHLGGAGQTRVQLDLPAYPKSGAEAENEAVTTPSLAQIWRGEAEGSAETRIVTATIALALLATDQESTAASVDERAQAIWTNRDREALPRSERPGNE